MFLFSPFFPCIFTPSLFICQVGLFFYGESEKLERKKKSQTYTILSVKKYIGCCGKFKRKLSIEEEDFSSTFRGRKPRKNM